MTKKILTKVKIDTISTDSFIYIIYNPTTELFAEVNYKEQGYMITENNKLISTVYPTCSDAILQILYVLQDERYYNHNDECKKDIENKIRYYKHEKMSSHIKTKNDQIL